MQRCDSIVKAAQLQVDKQQASNLDAAIDTLVDIKDDDSPVTQADKAVSDFIIEKLTKITPDIPVLSEEEPETHQAILQNHSTYWTLDPIDGTRTFINHMKGKQNHDGFGVHLGLIEDGVPTHGYVFFPSQAEQGVIYYTQGKAAYREAIGEPPKRMQANKPMLGAAAPIHFATGYKETFTQPLNGPLTQASPVVGGGRITAVCAGEDNGAPIDAALIAQHFSFWDVAAAHACLLKSGGDLYGAQSLDGPMHSLLTSAKPTRYVPMEMNGELIPAIPPSVAAHKGLLSQMGAAIGRERA